MPSIHPLHFLACLSVLSLATGAASETLQPVLLSETGSERATVGAGNLIVTARGKTHVVWQAADSGAYRSMIRTLDRSTGQWSEAVTLNTGKDNHARPYLTIDSDGFLHVVTSGHNTPFIHRKSARPHDSSEWGKARSFGSGTYPYLLAGPEGSLLLAARSAKHEGVDLYRMSRDGAWETIRRLMLKRGAQSVGYAGYNSVLQWGPGQKRLHFACDVYEGKTRGEIQMVVYHYTDDLGVTWHRADGTEITGDPSPNTMDILASDIRKRKNPLAEPSVRIGGLVVDQRSGSPYILLTTDQEPERGKAELMSPDPSGVWRDLGLDTALRSRVPGQGALGPAGGFTMTDSGTLQMAIPMAPLADWGMPEKKALRPGSIRLHWVETKDLGKSYSVRPIFSEGEAVERHAFSLEKPVGFNRVAADGPGTGALYFEGPRRYRVGNEIIQTRVFFLEMK